MFEGVPQQESIPIVFDALLDLIEVNGFEDPTARHAFDVWEKNEAEKISSDPERKDVSAQIDFEWKKIRLYFRGGRVDLAKPALRDLAVVCNQEGFHDDRDDFEEKFIEIGGEPIDWGNPFQEIE